jgi:hypothetical protein
MALRLRPDLAEFTRDLAPGRAGILTDLHLTEQAKRHNAVGVSGMRSKAPHSRIWLGGEWQDLPSLPEICGAEHVPLFTRLGLSTPGEQFAGTLMHSVDSVRTVFHRSRRTFQLRTTHAP